MPQDEEANEHSRLLDPRLAELQGRRRSSARAQSIVSSHVSKEEHALSQTAVGERLPYNDYTTIDWLHDLVCSLLYNCHHPVNAVRSRTPSAIDQFILVEV